MLSSSDQLKNTMIVLQNNHNKTTQLLAQLDNTKQKLDRKMREEPDNQYIELYQKCKRFVMSDEKLRGQLKENLSQNQYLINKCKTDAYAIVDGQNGKDEECQKQILTILEEISRMDQLHKYLESQVWKAQTNYLQFSILVKYCGQFNSLNKINAK